MIVTIGTSPTRIQYVNRGDIIFNEGLAPVYVDTIIGNVISAPQSSATPVAPGSTVQWAGNPGILYGKDPTGSNPNVGVTSQSGLPFPAPIVSGINLILNPGLQSSNYVTGVSGWRINRDGSAEFNNLTFRGTFTGPNTILNGTGFFTYSVAGGAAGKLIESSGIDANGRLDPFGNSCLSGETFYFDTGVVGSTRFLAMQLSGGGIAALIQWWVAATEAGPWTQLNMVVQGQANGGFLITAPSGFSIQGAASFQSVINSIGNLLESVASGNVIQFQTPGTGGWILSRAGDFQHLGGGNAIAEIHQGLEVEPAASGFGTLFLKNSVAAPSAQAGFAEPFAFNGALENVDGTDGGIYNTQHKTLEVVNQLINLVAMTPMTGISWPVAARKYKITGNIHYLSAVAAGASQFQFSGPAISASQISAMFMIAAGAVNAPVRGSAYTTIMTQGLTATDFELWFKGFVTFTAAGTVVLSAATTIAVDSYTIKDGWVTLEPVT